MFLRRARALEPQNVPPTPPTRPRPTTPFLDKLFGSNVSQADKDAAKARIKQLVGKALSLLRTTATLAADAAGDTAVQGLSIGLQALAEVLDKIETMGNTVEGVEELAVRVAELCAMIEQFISRARDHPLPEGMQERIGGLVETWKDIGERAKKIRARGKVARFIGSEKDAKALEGLIAEINDSIQDKIMTQGILNIEVAVQEANENITDARQEIAEVHKRVKAITAALDASFLSMYAKHAHYNTSEIRRSCLEGTRTALLDHIRGWIITASRKGADSAKKVFWICGLAGTGKTTVAYSIADWAETEKILGGDFFCSKFDPECNNPDLMFLTLSRQLCHFHTPFKEKVVEVLQSNPNVEYSTPDRQFEELIVEPLEALDTPFPLCVLVIDALDECKSKNASSSTASTVLEIIARFISRISRFLIFVVTSRPESYITAWFDKSATETLEGVTTSIELHMIERESTRNDIRQCLVEGLSNVPKTYRVPQGWPSDQVVDRLVVLADGLFVFVTTAIAFIMDKRHHNPNGRMQHLTNVDANTRTSGSVLDGLYAEVIEASHDEMSEELVDRLQKVLGAVALVRVPLSVSALAGLVGLSEDMVINTLEGLHSVLHVPTNRLDPILVIHPTFPEFLLRTLTPITSGAPATLDAFCIPPTRKHWFLFSQCLDAMSFLKRDVVGIRYPAKFKSEIEGFSELTLKAIPPHVRYASRYWATHLLEGLDDPKEMDVSDKFRSFMHERSLFWFEACLLLDIPAAAVLEAALSACRTLGGTFAELSPLLTDCHRFMQTNLSVILTAPLQLYHFALSIAPTGSDVRALYQHELEHSIDVCHGAPLFWPPSLDTFVGHGGGTVTSIAFSSSGICFASGGQDHRLRIWDTAARTELQSLDGHTDDVKSLAFSPDGVYVASGSEDKTACIWQVSSGARVHTLKGHTDPVSSVAYSADGSRVLSATKEGEVRLWDTVDGRCVFTLAKTGNETWQAALSPSGDVIARGEGASLALQDVSSATHEALSLPDIVEACTFSPDGRYVAARTKHAIRVWATADKALVRSIDMPDRTLCGRLAFSCDGMYIACGSENGPVYVWDIILQYSTHALNGHTDRVRDVSWSPDGLQLVSGADDGDIRLWDGTLHCRGSEETPIATIQHSIPPETFGQDNARFALVRFSRQSALLRLPPPYIEPIFANPQLPQGAPLWAAFESVILACDSAVKSTTALSSCSDRYRSWAFLTGQQPTKLGWRPIALSQGSPLLAYLSPTSTQAVDIFNLRTGKVVATLAGHIGDVVSVVFSSDGARLATGSNDGFAKVWDATSWALICSHGEHQLSVNAISISPDGSLISLGYLDGVVRIFEVATQHVVRAFVSNKRTITEVMFTFDDKHVVALDIADRVSIWELGSGTRVHYFSLSDNSWSHSLAFLSNCVSIRVDNDSGARTIDLWKTSSQPIDFFELDGWVYARLPGVTHRLCWIPPEWRTIMDSDGSTLCLRSVPSDAYPYGKLIAIDMSRILAYIYSQDIE